MEINNRINRRQFLTITALAGVAGTSLLVGCDAGLPNEPVSKKPFQPNAWVRIDPDSTITIRVAKSEMGQGVLTSLAMLVAEEMDADWAKVHVEQAPADGVYGDQATGGSESIIKSFLPLRQVGADVRALLIAAAASTWKVNVAECSTAQSTVINAGSGKKLSYGELTQIAASLPTNNEGSASLKDPSTFSLIGKSLPRVDVADIVTGRAMFGMDVKVPGMLYTVIARCPVFGGTVQSFDANAAKAVLGVREVIQVSTGVAVIAENTWAALQGREALHILWNEGANANLNSEQLLQQLKTSVQNMLEELPPPAPSPGGKSLEAGYELPYLAHATIEPINATADVQVGKCEVWAPTQDPQRGLRMATQISGLPDAKTKVHVMRIGGSFGRRFAVEYVEEAVQASKAVGKPVQLVWSREDDFHHDRYQPASYHYVKALLDAQNKLQGIYHAQAVQSMGNDITAGGKPPYDIESSARGNAITLPVTPGYWRGVDVTRNVFVMESFFDEIAAAMQVDPYQLRVSLLSHKPRLKALADLVAQKSNWGTALPAGWGRGMALYESSLHNNTMVAEVAEVFVDEQGKLKVERIVCAVDCGRVIHPAMAKAEVEGGIIFGLSAALMEEITVERGRIQQNNFADYPLLKMGEVPKIEVYFVSSTARPTGLGEPPTIPVAPAVANALFAATGKRIRRLPLLKEKLR